MHVFITLFTGDTTNNILIDFFFWYNYVSQSIHCIVIHLCLQHTPRIHIADIAPGPSTAKANKGNGGRKRQSAEVLTSSPSRQNRADQQERKLKAQPKSTMPKKGRKKTTQKSKNKENTRQYLCIYCHELYSDPPTEDWISCRQCGEWCHEQCADPFSVTSEGLYECALCK